MKQDFEWIPAIERLPEVDEEGHSRYILLNFDNFPIPSVGRYEYTDEKGGNFFEGDDDRSCLSYGFIVTAWAELPKPYREEDE